MQHTRIVWSFLGVMALTAWLSAPLGAQENGHVVAFETSEDDSTELTALRSEIRDLRAKLNATTNGGYDGRGAVIPAGYSNGCGCAVHEAGCGCEVGCGCEANYGCDVGCGCDSCCEPVCGTWGGFEPCCHCTGFWAEAEINWLKYHRADGARAAEDVDTEFDFEATPRLTIGYVRGDGLGARVRYWEFNHNAVNEEDEAALQVDTYNFDFEVFDTFALNCNWDLEVAFGIRYNEFLERMVEEVIEIRDNQFSGYGGLFSLELRRAIGTSGALFARGRAAVLMDDKHVFMREGDNIQNDVTLRDVTVAMAEIAFGYQFTQPICGGGYYFFKVQAEWQNWFNYSSAFETVDSDENFAGPADVGFGGFGIAAGIAR